MIRTGRGDVTARGDTLSLGELKILDMTMGIRVSAEEEAEGLDMGEHAMSAYPHFQTAREQ